MTRVGRARVLAYRVAAQGLDRAAAHHAATDLAILDLGVQEAMGHPAALALLARLSPSAVLPVVGPGAELALVWSVRGAPHVHRRSDLAALAGALWPLSEADAATRLGETRPSVVRSGVAALDQFALAVRELRAEVGAPTAKGAASEGVSRRIPEGMLHACRGCGVSHIGDQALRLAALPAGVELEPGTAPPTLCPRDGARVPTGPDTDALERLVGHYLALLGPATPADVAGYLGARRAQIAEAWPADLVEVSVDGRRAYLPADRLGELTAASPPELVRLLGPFDPWLQARDRDLIVPDAAVQRTLWPVLGRPGVLFVDGEVVGTWRPRTAGRRLTITVDAFAPLPPSVWPQVDAEAAGVARARGAADVRVIRQA